jgi:eukaryotic-like serine/threonine-protein kinase
MHVTARVFVGAVAIVALVLGTVFTVARAEARRTTDASAARALEQSADLVAQLLAGRGRSLAGGARVFVQGPYFRTLVAESRRDDILDQTFEAAEQLDASWVFITDASGMLVAKSDEPSASGDQLANVALISGALRGQVMTGFGGSGDSALFQATAVPVAAPGGSPFGVLVATRLLDSAMAVDIATATGSELVFYVRTADGVAHVAASTMARDSSLRAAVRRRASGQDPLVIDGREWRSHATALNTAGGTEVGGYLVLRRALIDVPAVAALRRAMAIASALGLLLAGVAALVAHRTVTVPTRRLASDGQALSRELEITRRDLHDQRLLAGLLSADGATPAPAGRASAHTPEPPVSAEPSRPMLPRRPRVERTLSLPRSRHADDDVTPFALGSMVAQRYRLDAILGERDRGVLYRAFDAERAESVALGVVRPERLFLDDDALALLAADVATASRVVHPHVARVYDVGHEHDVPFVTSEFVPGVSLARVLRQRGTLPPDLVLALARAILRALAAAHAQRVLHGDLKPSDIRVTPSGQVKITGFGIAHALRDAAQRAQSVQRAGDATLTGRLAGATVGTPEYLAPEQLVGASASSASDLYAVGVVLHECLAGHTPHRSDMPVTLIGGRLRDESGEHPRTGGAAWPPPLDLMIAGMTENDAYRRAPSAAYLLELIETSANPQE